MAGAPPHFWKEIALYWWGVLCIFVYVCVCLGACLFYMYILNHFLYVIIFWHLKKPILLRRDSLSLCCCSVSKLCLTLNPSTAAHQSSLSFTISLSLLKSCPLSQWCHPTTSSSVVPFSSCPQSFPASGSFQRSWLFTSGGQSTGALASALVLPMNIKDWFPLGLTGFISLLSKGLSRAFSSSTVWKHQFFDAQPSSGPAFTSVHTTGKTIALTRWTFVGKLMSLLCDTLSRFAIAFLPRSKCVFISWLQSQSTVIWGHKKSSLSLFALFIYLFAMKWWDWTPWP